MKVVFFGMNTSFSAVHLLALRTEHEIAAVFVTTERPPFFLKLKAVVKSISGIVSTGAFSLMKSCSTYSIPYFTVDSVNDDAVIEQIKKITPDVICMAGFSEKLSKPLISVPKYGILNSHSSILPSYRGANPFFWMIKENKPEPGCTIHFVDEGFDTGPIMASASFDLFPGCNLSVYNSVASVTGGRLMCSVVKELPELKNIPEKQNEKSVNCRNPRKEDLIIDNTFYGEQALWMFNAFSDALSLYIKRPSGISRCKKMSSSPFKNSEAFDVADGKVYILAES